MYDMEYLILGEQPSFQQQVFKLQVQGEEAFLKRIISDYSWWTFDQCDIYLREKTSHGIMSTLTSIHLLLYADDNKREFVTKALPRPDFTPAHATGFIHAALDVLAAMRRQQDTSLDRLTLSELAISYSQKAMQASVSSHLVNEVCNLLERWERSFGSTTCYVHGDLHLGNLLEQDGVLYPFDYEEAIQSLPALDSANLSAGVYAAYGDEGYQYFRQQHQQRFDEDLIERRDWQRFCHLRNWIASCYLRRCCDVTTAELAKAFIVDEEPQ